MTDITVIKEELIKKENKELDKLLKDGVKQSFIDRRANELNSLLDGYIKKKNDLILECHKIKIEESALKENIERLSDIEEQLEELYKNKNELLIKGKVINIAINKLDEAYEELKLEVIPEMEKE